MATALRLLGHRGRTGGHAVHHHFHHHLHHVHALLHGLHASLRIRWHAFHAIAYALAGHLLHHPHAALHRLHVLGHQRLTLLRRLRGHHLLVHLLHGLHLGAHVSAHRLLARGCGGLWHRLGRRLRCRRGCALGMVRLVILFIRGHR